MRKNKNQTLLRVLRRLGGFTQDRISRLSGLSRTSLSRCEAGRRELTADERKRLARVFGVDPSVLD